MQTLSVMALRVSYLLLILCNCLYCACHEPSLNACKHQAILPYGYGQVYFVNRLYRHRCLSSLSCKCLG